jgi:hypothetical protein
MSHMKHVENEKSEKNKNQGEDEHQKWFDRDDLQDLAKFGGDILKKTMATGMDVIKEVKENFPKEATQFIAKGKEELLKGLSQEMAKNMVSFGIEKFFSIARQHRIEFSIRVRRDREEENRNTGREDTMKRKRPKV